MDSDDTADLCRDYINRVNGARLQQLFFRDRVCPASSVWCFGSAVPTVGVKELVLLITLVVPVMTLAELATAAVPHTIVSLANSSIRNNGLKDKQRGLVHQST